MPAGKEARQRILDAALELFCRNGYDGASTRAIARKAGVNEVTIFRLFRTKDHLLLSVIDREADIGGQIPPGSLEPTDDVASDLARFGGFMLKGMLAKAPLMKLGMTEMQRRPAIWRHISPAPTAAVGALEAYFDKAARKGLIRKVDPHLAALVFFSFFFRSMAMTTFLGRDMLMKMDERAIRDFCSLFVEGLGKR